ncbi:MAG: type IV pilin [Thermoplasmata archaeon]|nr:MAG: type IV pilin [Thermoplasmata archaeon]
MDENILPNGLVKIIPLKGGLEMKKRVRKKIVWDDHGISEILADILILAMTVVLFAIIFAFVYSLPAPNEATYADFESDLTLDANGARINMTHNSGENLYQKWTDIYLFKNPGKANQEVRRLTTKSSSDPYGDNPRGYGLQDDATWSPAETWTYYFRGVSSADDLEIKIVDTNFQSLIISHKLLGAGVNDAPIIMERWYNPAPAVNAHLLTISAYVMDNDGIGDLSAPGAVSANVSAINSTLDTIDFTMVSSTEKTGHFEGDVMVDMGEGSFTLTLTAEDASGLIDRGRIVIYVGSTALNAPRILERWTIPEVGVNGTDITVFCKVEDIDDNLDYVNVDIGPLEDPNGTSNVVNMTDPEGDGIFEYSTIAHVAKGDLYRLNFTARDITELEDRAHLNVSVKRFNPIISRMWTVPTIGKDDELITIYAEVFDPDGYSDIMDVMLDPSNLNPDLGWENMTDPEQDGIFEFNLTINVSTGGNKTVSFLARDMNGNDVMAQMKVFIRTRNAPVILNRWTNPNFPDNNTQLSIFASVMDPDGYDDIDFVRVNVTSLNRTLNGSAGWVYMIDPNQDGSFMNISWVDQEAGTYMLEFEAYDKGGNMGYATLNLTILPYRPRFLNAWTNPTIGRNGTNIQIFANVMDPNGYTDIVNVTVDIVQLNESYNQSEPMWVEMIDFNMNGTFLNTTKINVSNTGLYSLNFTVLDEDGNIARTNLQLLITSYKPVIVDTWYSPAPAVNGTNVTIFAWIWDEDGLEDIYSVMINVSELSTNLTWVNMTDPDGNRIFENVTFIDSINVTGIYNATIVAIDTTGNMANATLKMEIAPVQPPSQEIDPTVFGMAYPNAVGGGSQVWFSAYASNGSAADEQVFKVEFSWEGVTYTMDRVIGNYFRYSNSFTAPLVGETQVRDVDVWAKNASDEIIATDTIKLLILFDESGGEVTKATALQKMVAWIAYDQGFVITNNKTSNRTVQIFELFDPKDAMCHVKIGSNSITNMEKVNEFRVTSRTTGEVIGPPYLPDDLKFAYDGVMAGYWFFNLSFSTSDLFQYVTDSIPLGKFPPGTNAEYFDIYMYIKDTTDDYFMTESWIVVTNSTSPDFYPYLNFYYDSDYIPGVPISDGDSDKIPDDGVQGPVSEYHVFQNTEVLYVEIITETTDSVADVTFTNLEIQDFWGNHMVSNPPNSGAVGPISTHTKGGETHYIVAVDLLRADKDPWLMGRVAYTVIITGFKENVGDQEEFAYLAKQVIIESPSSIMDIVSGHEHAQGATFTGKYHGHFYENMNGYWERYLYAYQGPSQGQTDYIGDIWSVAFDDLDGDTDREIVTGRAGENNPTLSIWENIGGANFEELIIDDELTGEINSVAIGHIDKIGSREPKDLVIGTSDGYVIYYRNDGTWDVTAIIATGVGTVSVGNAIEIADLDNDGDGDVVVGTSTGVKIIQNPIYGGGGWQLINLHNPGTVISVSIGYLQENYDTPAMEDQYLDIVIGDADGDIWRYLNDDSDISAPSWDSDTVATNIDGQANVYVDIGDISGLTYLDVVAGCDDTLIWYENQDGGSTWSGSGNIIGTLPSPGSQDITAVRVGNVDGAIEEDIVISTTGESQGQNYAGGLVYYYRNLGRASEWKRFKVDDLFRLGAVMDIHSIAIGDADLGS